LVIPDDAVRRGLAAVCWPGRLDVVQTQPLVVLDGAHNADGIGVLVRELPGIVGQRDIHLLFGVMRDKRWRPMVKMLGPHIARVMLAPTLPPRGEDVDVLAEAFAPYCPVSRAATPLQALRTLVQNTGEDDAILVAGSLFLVGDVFPFFLHRHGHPGLFPTSATNLHP
jgi:folylpolyglutamate synthase/dihydropteroate synthase